MLSGLTGRRCSVADETAIQIGRRNRNEPNIRIADLSAILRTRFIRRELITSNYIVVCFSAASPLIVAQDHQFKLPNYDVSMTVKLDRSRPTSEAAATLLF